MAFAEQARPRQAIAALLAQAEALYGSDSSSAGHPGPPVRLAAPLDVILSFNGDDTEEAQFVESVSDLLIERDWMTVRHLPVANGSYCRQKNAGARASNADLVIFLDSDVTPEPTWLMAFMQAFVDTKVSVAVGNTYVDTSRGDAYSRSMALTWMFPLRDEVGGLTRTTWFYANNVAFRREVILAHPFPDTPGLKHHGAVLLLEKLAESGIELWHVGEARGNHPPPNGIIHFFTRAVAAGRARALTEDAPGLVGPVRWARTELAETGWLCGRIVRDGASVDLQWWQVPAAMGVTMAYYSLRLCGSLATFLAPGLMRTRFNI